MLLQGIAREINKKYIKIDWIPPPKKKECFFRQICWDEARTRFYQSWSFPLTARDSHGEQRRSGLIREVKLQVQVPAA